MFAHRLRVLLAIIGAGFFILAARLFYLQVLCYGYYDEKAEQNIAFTESLPTLRGVIFDRNWEKLATSRVEYEVRVWLNRLEKLSERDRERWFRLVAEALEVSPAEVQAAAARADQRAQAIAMQRSSPEQQQIDLQFLREHLPQPIYFNVPKERVVRLELGEFRLPLYVSRTKRAYPVLDLSDSTRRIYPFGATGSNLLGYMAQVTEQEYMDYRDSYDDSALKSYRMDELIGRAGLEYYYNRVLRGSRGERMGMRDARGRVQEELSVVSPVAGTDVRLSIDVRLQRLLEAALDAQLRKLERDGLGHNGGAAVMMDPNTGDVLACATSPRFDPNTITEDYPRLATDPSKPFNDRARRGRYPLGSVFKVVVALAGLESGVITGATEYTCTGSITVAGKTFKCTKEHGTLRLEQAIEQSCNCYFYQAGLAIGGRRIHDMGMRLGLGTATGLELAESVGYVPLPASEQELVNLSIGGGRLLVTPLQAARLMCVFANSGQLPEAKLDVLRPAHIMDLGIEHIKISPVRRGMYGVVMGSSGTARNSGRVQGLRYAAKTGTANLSQVGLYDAWYCGFAPFKGPKIAFAAVIEHTQEYGGLAAAPLIRDVFTAMLADPELAKYLTESETGGADDGPGGGK